MTHRITAEFSNQLAAASAVDKLLSRGTQRDQISTLLDESRGDTPVTAIDPTTVVPGVSRDGTGAHKPDGKLNQKHLPQYGTDPRRFGYARVVVTAADKAAAAAIRDCLTTAGGQLCDEKADSAASNEGDTAPNSSGEKRPEDVQRAIDASRGGAALR